MEANADAIRTKQRHIADLTEQMEDIGDAGGKLQAMPPVNAQAASPEFQGAMRQRQWNEREAALANQAGSALRSLQGALAAALTAFRGAMPASFVIDESSNREVAAKLDAAVRQALPDIAQSIENAARLTQAAEHGLGVAKADLDAAHTVQAAAYLALQQKNQEAVQALESRSAAEKAVQKLEALRKEIAQVKAELAQCQTQRQDLKTAFLLSRDRLSEVREEVARRLQSEAVSKVRIWVQRNADNLEYQERLTAALKGSNLKNQADILRTLTGARPEDLAQMIRENDIDEFEAQLGFGKERSKKVFEAMRLKEDPRLGSLKQ